jgi:hypothetical protein
LWIVSSIPSAALTPAADVARSAAGVGQADDRAALAQRDPMALVERGRAWYEANVHEYRCVLVKQERLGDELSPVQEVELRFRAAPRAVYMLWKSNADQAKRALFLGDDSNYVDKNGEALARVEPAGAIARLFVKDIYVPLHGAEAHKASRRTLDEAGFGATFDLLEAYNAVAAKQGVLDIRYGGTGRVDGRPTYVIVRDLPYEDPSGPYPDARMVLHLDQQWLLPVAVYSYADHDEKTLLGSYVFTHVELNPSFDGNAFRF